MKSFDHLVFDLDDTLLDTNRQLVPHASRDACTAMVEAGLATDIETCLLACGDYRKEPHLGSARTTNQELFPYLVERFGVRNGVQTAHIEDVGFRAFYDRRGRISPDISLFPRAGEMLLDLQKRYDLYLVTSGSPETQEEKIRILGIRELFKEIRCVNLIKGERKFSAFADIMASTKTAPERHLSIGNRIDTDIAEARRLDWKTCWVRYGEYVALEPSSEVERPDFVIDDISELVTTCQL